MLTPSAQLNNTHRTESRRWEGQVEIRFQKRRCAFKILQPREDRIELFIQQEACLANIEFAFNWHWWTIKLQTPFTSAWMCRKQPATEHYRGNIVLRHPAAFCHVITAHLAMTWMLGCSGEGKAALTITHQPTSLESITLLALKQTWYVNREPQCSSSAAFNWRSKMGTGKYPAASNQRSAPGSIGSLIRI